MGGGLMQLVAYGAQDIYLTGNPQITFFKVVYRRHTNFSMETIQQTLNGGGSGAVHTGSATCTISRNGDLVHKVYVTADSASATSGSALVQEVELEIGGQRIDRHYKGWNEVWNELSTPESKAIALKAMQCEIGTGGIDAVETIQIPLNFWFCRNPGLALPLIALQYHEVKLKFKWGDVGGAGVTPELYCDYIYLDTDERRRFAQVSHEYLIEQLQRGTYTATNDNKLNFNHPVKELIWVNTIPNAVGVKYQLKLNGHDRFKEQPKDYFMLRQPFDYHTAVPRQNLPPAAQLTSNMLNVGNASDHLIGGGTSVVDCVSSVLMETTDFTSAVKAASVATNNSGASTEQVRVGLLISNIELGGSATFTNETPFLNNGGAPLANPSTVSANQIGFIFLVAETVKLGFTTSNIGKLFRLTVKTAEGTVNKFVTLLGVQTGTNSNSSDGEVDDSVNVVSFDKNIFGNQAVNADASSVEKTTDDLTTGFQIEEIKLMTPDSNVATEARTSKMTSEINVYSFALKPEEHQPSGTCNFSRIDNAQLKVTNNDGGGTIYAVNYNVLRIMSGMGGLAYSN